MAGTVTAMLPDGRLHLQDGPIDLIIGLDGTRAAVAEAARRAAAAFEGLLAGLAAELPLLRRPVGVDPPPLRGPVARRMAAAVWPFRRGFITPMAAVAGAVAEEVLEAITGIPGLLMAHVNNGGDIALFLAPGQVLRIGLVPSLERAAPEGLVRIAAADAVRGVATSGWPGRKLLPRHRGCGDRSGRDRGAGRCGGDGDRECGRRGPSGRAAGAGRQPRPRQRPRRAAGHRRGRRAAARRDRRGAGRRRGGGREAAAARADRGRAAAAAGRDAHGRGAAAAAGLLTRPPRRIA
ncbi:hypothetical protein [Dankookia sp. P2]|uniref:hypothetical protein n=1 Tax=Dankookia sp. P2 TaxID=3423955 RepID=UPI003D6735C4